MAGDILLGDLWLCEISFVETPSHVPKKYIYIYMYIFSKAHFLSFSLDLYNTLVK